MRKPFFRKQTQSYYVESNGKQIALGKDREKAFAKYHILMLGRQAQDIEIGDLFDLFLTFCSANRERRTAEFYSDNVRDFEAFAGRQSKVSQIKPYHVTQWLAARNGGDTFKHNSVVAIKRAFNWAVDEGYIECSPIAKCKAPQAQPREVYIEPNDWQKLLASIKHESFRDALIFLRHTGCRPFELRQIEAKHFDGKCIVFERKKSKGRRKQRVIPLTETAANIVATLAKKYPSGPIFRTKRKTAWTKSALGHACRYHAKKHKVPLFPYAIRHTFCTDMLNQGMDPIKLAEIMGHSDLKMIMAVYQHLNLKRDTLREQLNKFVTINDSPIQAA